MALLIDVALSACRLTGSPPPTPTPVPPTATATPSPRPTATSTITLTDTSPPPSPTATPDYAQFEGVLSTYTNEEFGFAFDYPAIYDQEPFLLCAPRSYSSGDFTYVEMGPGVLLSIFPAEGRTTDEYVDQALAELQRGGDLRDLEIERNAAPGNLVGVGLTYRFGAFNRLALVFVFTWRGNIYVAQYVTYGSLECDVPEASVHELDLLSLMLRTFRFTR